MEIQHLLQNYKIEKPKIKSERADVISQIYDIYIGDKQSRKKENWKRYCKWCRDNRKPKGSEKEFKKTKLFIKEMQISSFCYFLSHIPTKDLYYILSIVKDKRNRGENVGAFILGSVLTKVESPSGIQ